MHRKRVRQPFKRRDRIFQQAGKLTAFGHRRAEQARQAIQRIVPARLSALHLDAHCVGIQCGILDGA